MGFAESGKGAVSDGVNMGECLRSFVRRKRVDSEHSNNHSSGHQLAKALSVHHLIAIGEFCDVLFFIFYYHFAVLISDFNFS